MNRAINTLKISNYDKFKCIADKCRFTCCEGWDVSIDADIYNKWKKEKIDYILDNVKTKKGKGKTEYFVNKKTEEACPFLDKQGLCKIVKSNREESLPLICHVFPRLESIFEDRKELSLSCACPEVVEIISSMDGKINMSLENGTDLKSNSSELKIREILVNFLQQENFSLEHKMMIGFQMLLTMLENESFSEDDLLEEIEKYNDREYIKHLIDMYNEIDINLNESIEEINYLFLDIIQNYKEVPIFKLLLKDISTFAQDIEIRTLCAKWYNYKDLLKQYDNLIENCIVSKILSSCTSKDVEEFTVSFQMIILEYLLVRYAVFLKYCMDKKEEINIEDIKDYIVVFSRIIENNTEAVLEFFREGFGDVLIEMGYLCFITLF